MAGDITMSDIDLDTHIAVTLDMQRYEYRKLVIEMQRDLRRQQREAREIGAYTSVAICMAQEDILEQATERLGLRGVSVEPPQQRQGA
jgi:CelD/BcsL family acetyltransferase involved in cellulose biosynthesis